MVATTSDRDGELVVELVGTSADTVRRLGALMRRHAGATPTATALRWTADGSTAVIRFADRDTPQPASRLLVIDGPTASPDDVHACVGSTGAPLCFVNDPAPEPLADLLSRIESLGRSTANGSIPLHVQLPLPAAGNGPGGIFDLIQWKAMVWQGEGGDGSFAIRQPAEVDELPGLPDGFWDAARAGRNRTEDLLRSRYPEIERGQDRGETLDGLLHGAIRWLRASSGAGHMPVLYGSTDTDVGIQPLLDAIVRYGPTVAR